MKYCLILLLGIFAISCNQSNQQSADATSDQTESLATEEVEHFDWLLGKWRRLNNEEGQETFENWEKVSATEYQGLGFTLQNGDTVSQENMRFIKSGETWDVIVQVPESPEAVTFKGTSYTEDEFVCENQSNDFPKTIKYWKSGEMIKAVISNSDLEITFDFERIAE